MARKARLRCPECARHFGGDEGKRKHKRLKGDRMVCKTDAELWAEGWTRDLDYVWHRPVGATAKPSPSAPVRPTLFDAGASGVEPTNPEHIARSSDPLTSKVAARAMAYRTGSAKARLLQVYLDAYIEGPTGLTDEEAAARVGMELYAATKRCADLRNDGWIVAVGVRKGSSGLDRQVCAVAEAVSA